ncbi:hypothetical protein HGRIS_014736 [Hohenbuehelia grisea]|uniref:RNA-dependent RNA polymerase n=1 Tax=Hohenbuehelia grisea TaxID=104357 RepID=A0ABR3IQJ7_9AGAR
MQIFMRNVSFAMTEDNLKAELAKRIHQPPFPLEPLTNFHVGLFHKRGSRTHKGSGLLTFPTTAIGNTFLAVFGQQGLWIHGRRISFAANNREPNQGLIQKVASTQWEDPETLRQEQQRIAKESAAVRMTSFAFGRYCRDGVFSAEVLLETSHVVEASCDVAKHQLVVTARPPAAPPSFDDTIDELFDMFDPVELHSVRYPASSIIHLATTVNHPYRIFLESSNPPVFIRTTSSMLDADVSQRTPSLTGQPEMPPVTQAICLTFGTEMEQNIFLMHCRSLHLPRPDPNHRNIIVEHRELYSPSEWNTLNGLLASVPFPLAFEVEKSIWNGTFVPHEITGDLRQEIIALAQDADHASSIFKSFVLDVEIPGIVTIPAARPARPRRRRRGRKQRNNQEQERQKERPSLPQRLAESANTYRANLLRPRGRLEPVVAAGIYRSYHIAITPTGRLLEGPLPDQSNSVLRRFENFDCFLRLSFQDETRSKPRRDPGLLIDELLMVRYKPYLVSGIDVAGHHYDFLGYSMSGLKDYSFAFVRPFEFQGTIMDASGIRDTLGDFSAIVTKPALLGARWSQAFSASDPSVVLTKDELQRIVDRFAEDRTNFTDGVGTISSQVAREVWSNLQRTRTKSRNVRQVPSAYQFRLGGAKGVLVHDPHLKGRVVCLRPSQLKFEGPSLSLDIATTSARPISVFLNRPLIALLEFYGTDPDVIFSLQEKAIADVDAIHDSLSHASMVFSQHGLGSSFKLPSLYNNIQSILGLDVGHIPDAVRLDHALLNTCLLFGATHILRDIKHRAHIYVPGSVTLIGVADEWDCLDEGEIYAAVDDERNAHNLKGIITGTVMITRSPQIHPGDVQFVTAVRKAKLAHLKNVVVFSCRGRRSLPSCLGGGDLDGDIYNLILDPNLFPKSMRTGDPGSYKGLPHKETTLPCTVSDVADFVLDFIKTDLLGHISILHLRIADHHDPSHPDCLVLAEKASHAVDFPKTGTPVDFRSLPRAPSELKPDFLSGEGVNPEASNSSYYPSQKLLGRLYRNVPLPEHHIEREDLAFTDADKIMSAIEAQGLIFLGLPTDENWEETEPEVWEEMEQILEEYSDQLLEISKVHTISKRPNAMLSEAELVSGTNQAKWADHRRRREAVTAMNLQTAQLTNAIRREIRRLPVPEEDASTVHEDDADDGETQDDYYSDEEFDFDDYDGFFSGQERRRGVFKRAWIAWAVSQSALADDPVCFGPLSFGVVALGMMLETIKEQRRWAS